MTIDEMKRIKQQKGYSYQMIAEKSGVPAGTLQKILRGTTGSPRYETLQALERFFRDACTDAVRDTTAAGYTDFNPAGLLRETKEVYAVSVPKKQGEYTLDDYYALPDDKRFELIDGVIFEMNAPTTFHQLLAGEIYRQISNFILEHDGSCMPFISPVDVQLDEDDRTMVQPDVIIICSPDRILAKNIFGAPDFVLEVVSPESKRKDYLLKLEKYKNARVKEYWLVDPYQRTVITYLFDADDCTRIYPIDAPIPVRLYDEQLIIDLKRMVKWLPEQ